MKIPREDVQEISLSPNSFLGASYVWHCDCLLKSYLSRLHCIQKPDFYGYGYFCLASQRLS